jgi:hypothetical protein
MDTGYLLWNVELEGMRGLTSQIAGVFRNDDCKSFILGRLRA